MEKAKYDIKSMTIPELEEMLKEFSQPAYRAKQLFHWLHSATDDFSQMSDLPKALRETLAQRCEIRTARVVRKLVSRLDDTVKYLFALVDGEYVESVVMHYQHGDSICISTQVGCRMGCTFCATALGGLKRNLTASEMLAQITAAQKDLNIRISHVVLMGMGEPLDNYDAVLRFLTLACDPQGLNISARHISLSTCGRVDGIRKLMQEKLQLTLSISLHAPNDQIRNRMMPINHKWNIDCLLDACRDYCKVTGRRISFEYTVIEGVNDSPQCAEELARRLKGMLCHVNLIPVNPVDGTPYHSGGRKNILHFQTLLLSKGLNATIRRTLGADINASCGQLRGRTEGGDCP